MVFTAEFQFHTLQGLYDEDLWMVLWNKNLEIIHYFNCTWVNMDPHKKQEGFHKHELEQEGSSENENVGYGMKWEITKILRETSRLKFEEYSEDVGEIFDNVSIQVNISFINWISPVSIIVSIINEHQFCHIL